MKIKVLSVILVTFVSLIFYLYITTVSNPKDVSDDMITSSESTESSADSLSVTDITLPNYEDESDYKHYSEELIDKIKQDPLADFDTVSGATFSIGAVKDAYNKALKQAGLK